MPSENRNVTLRRTIQQVIHCLEEAESVLGYDEDPRCAADDIDQAQRLIEQVVKPGVSKIVRLKSQRED